MEERVADVEWICKQQRSIKAVHAECAVVYMTQRKACKYFFKSRDP